MIHYLGHDKKGREYFPNVPQKEKESFANFLRSLGYLVQFEDGKIVAK